MSFRKPLKNNRILIVDDNESIHEDIRSILCTDKKAGSAELANLEDELFGSPVRKIATGEATSAVESYVIDDAFQGEEAIAMVQKAAQEEYPYSLIFMDVRMPPGMDGIETIQKIWERYPYIEMVICTAYSDYSWDEIVANFGMTDKLLLMKKPFDATALRQITLTLLTKWQLHQKNSRYIEDLELEVKERTSQLNSLVEELKFLKEKAESASSAKSQFLANMSHEIRTPIHGVLGLTDLLLSTELNIDQRELSEGVKLSAESLLGVINDILDFSKIEAGKLEIGCVKLFLSDVLDEVIKILSVSTKKKSLDLTLQMADDIPSHLAGDPIRLRQILLNFGSNAVKFTEEGSISIVVKKIGEDANSMTVRFEVQDTGIGIPADKQDLLFQGYSQVDNSNSRRYEGTGLGLAICKQLAELMHGEVGFDSVANKGSTFWFSAKMGKVYGDARLDAHEITVVDPDEVELPPLKILVAEDNMINQKVAKRMLERMGCQVELVGNGKAAVKAAKDGNYDVILMDIQMPEMDGFAATAAIRAAEATSGAHVPIIALTANAMQDVKKHCMESGMDYYITKPVDLGALVNALRKCCGLASNDKAVN